VNLRELVQRGHFREDLYYRISPITIQVPPLRVRTEDIALLANAFLREMDSGRGKKFSAEGLRTLSEDYDWPGNVRELRAVVKSLAVTIPFPVLDRPEIRQALGLDSPRGRASAPTAEGGFAPDWSLGFDENIAAFEKHLLGAALEDRDSNGAREILKLSRSRFYEKLKTYGLNRAGTTSS